MAVNVTGGALEFDASINLDSFEASLRRMQQGLNSLADAANNQTSAIENLAAKAATAIGAYLTINAAKGFVSELVNVRGEFEQLGVAFRTMLGNKEQADKLMAQAVQLAATTPFKLSDVATGAKQLLAYGTAAEKIPDTLKMLGNVASGVSAPLQDIVYLYGTLQTQGRAYTRDILQFTSRGIPIIDALAKQFGVTTAQVQELVEAGKVGFPEIQKAFQTMTSQGGMFFNLMEEQSKTVTGMLSNLGDAFDKMLNDIGQSNEGIIKGSIEGLTTLVSHYQDVIDILKVLLATYGAYKTAVIATGVYNAIAAEAVAGYTLAETLRFRAMLLSEGAMNLLNKTMLANPYVAVATAITALVGAYLVLHDTTTQVKDSQHLLADAQKDVGDKMAETEAKIRPYVEALKGANVSENERLNIYNKLKAIDPSIVDGLNAKTISYDALTKNVNKYLDALRNQISLEANGKAVTASIQQENNIQKQIDDLKKLQKAREEANKIGGNNIATNAQSDATADQLKSLTAQLEQQKKVTHDLGEAQVNLGNKTETTNAAQKRTVEVIDAQISELKKQQVAVSASSREWQDYQNKIVALQKEREGITGKTSQQLKAQQGEENKINTILNERQGILDKLAGLQRDSQQSGLLPTDSAVDNIKQKYDNAIKAIEDYNKKVAVFNKQNGTNVKGIGIADVDKLKQAEQQEIANTIYKQDSANYIASLDDKKKAFEDFQTIQQQGNDEETAFAKQKYAEQIGDFKSYLDYLKSQQSDLQFKISVEPNNVGLQQSLLAVNKAVTEEQNKQSAANIKQQIDDYTRLFAATANYNQKRKSIDTQYYKDVALLARQYSGQELQDRLDVLKQSKQSAIDQAKDEVFQKTELYQKLNIQIVELTRSQVKSQIEAIQTVLSKGVDMPPDLRKQLQSQLDGLQKSLNFSSNTNFVNQLKAQKQAAEDALATGKLSTEEFEKQKSLIAEINDELKNQTIKTFQTISNDAIQISGALSNLASAIQPLNAGLADTVQTLSDIGQLAGNAASAFASFASGDIVGGIGKTINVIAGIFSIGAKARESQRKAQDELKTYQDSIIKGELAYNELLRGRERTIKNINDLTSEQLRQQLQLLATQKQQALADEQRLLSLIQQQGQQVTGETTEKTGGFLGIGRKTKTVQQLAGLSDADYTQLEKLFTEGKLDENTSKWFQELQKVHDELDGIGESAQQVADQLNQTLTGTTSQSIADSIKDGLAQGYDSAADFASNLQSLFTNAILSAFEANQIKPAMEQFYNELAQFNSDGLLDQGEIDQLTKVYNTTVDGLAKQYDQIKQIAGLSDTNTASTNSLVGAIKGMTEQTGELLAGQFGGLRLTAASQLSIATQQLQQLNMIATYTADIPNLLALWRQINNTGIKIKG